MYIEDSNARQTAKQFRKLQWSFRAEAGLKGGKAAGGNPSVSAQKKDT